jgi:hypothetical protein
MAGGPSAEVSIRICSPERSSAALSPNETQYEISADVARLTWKDVGTFVVRRREVLVYPLPNVAVEVLQQLLLGPVLAVLLEQRGYLVLHASSAMFEDGAVAFLGASGWGKSTLAAALHSRGHAIVADDFVALTVEASGVLVQPGFPQVRLLRRDASLFGYSLPPDPGALADKTRYPVPNGFPTMPQQLRRIYVLGEGACRQIEELDPQDALIELIRHTYTARLLDSKRSPSNFSQCAGVATKIPIRRLRAGRELSALPEVADLVERDVRCA